MIIQRYLPFVAGAERQLAAIVKRLPEHGIEPLVITRRYGADPTVDMIEGTPVRRIANPGPRVMAAASFTLGAIPVLRAFRPDLIHAHELLSPTTTALAAKPFLRVPVIAKILRGGRLGDITKLREGGPVGALRLNAIKSHVDRFVVISREIDAELASLGVAPERRRFVPNGVDAERFRPASAAERAALRRELGLPEAPVAVFGGRLEKEKRIGELMDIWPRLRQRIPGATLVVAGEGSLRATLEARRVEGVRFIGHQDDMTRWYQAADIFVLPSAAEGLSNALLEAMASGLICVATAVGAAPDLLADGRGHLVADGNDAALERLLGDALSGRDTPGTMGAAARRQVVEHYSLDATVRGLADLYRELAPTGPRGTATR